VEAHILTLCSTNLGDKRTRTSDSTVVSTVSRLFLVQAFLGASPKSLLQFLSPTLLIHNSFGLGHRKTLSVAFKMHRLYTLLWGLSP